MDSVAFEIFGFQIYWYGILTAAGFLVGFRTASTRAPRAGISSEAVLGLAPWLIIGTIIGARGLYVISYWDEEFAGKPFMNVFQMRTGLVFYGGLIGASAGGIIYCLKNKIPLWSMGDVMAPSVALGHAIGRLGCFMTGCCYGVPTSMPWAVHFPADHWTRGVGVHPTQIYESLLNLGLYFGLAWLYRRRRFDGEVFAAYLIAYAFLRAFVEMFRGDYEKFYLGGIATPGQAVSILIMAAGLLLWWKQRGRPLTPALKAA